MLRWVVLPVILIFTFSAFAFDRVILLSPAAADIVIRLGAEEKIVGKTKSVEEIAGAVAVGSHIRPNMELIMSLKPDLIIVSSNRFFTEEMVRQAGVPVVEYNPVTLKGILEGIRELGNTLGRVEQAEQLIRYLEAKLAGVASVAVKPKVIFETMQVPYTVAGEGSIIADIIRSAGGDFIVTGDKKMIRYSEEAVIASAPDIYIYQTGPMNKNPEPPKERGIFRTMQAEYINVDEREFSRANSVSFENVLKLNKIFSGFAEREK